jgi:hypothetical protein
MVDCTCRICFCGNTLPGVECPKHQQSRNVLGSPVSPVILPKRHLLDDAKLYRGPGWSCWKNPQNAIVALHCCVCDNPYVLRN